MHPYARILDEIISLLNTDLYGLRGVIGERLLVSALREGKTNVYTYDGSRLVKLNEKPVNGVLEAKYNVSKAIIMRDVAKGREQYMLYEIDPDAPGVEKPVEGVEPARILGGSYDDEVLVYGAATMAENAIFLVRDGKRSKVATLPGFAAVIDHKWPIAVGIGALKPTTGKFQLFIADLEKGDVKIHERPDGSILMARIAPDDSIVYTLDRSDNAVLMKLDPATMEDSELSLPGDDLKEYKPVSFNYIGYTPGGSLIAVARKNGRSKIFLDGRLVKAPEGIHGAVYEWKGGLAVTHTSLSLPPRIIKLGGNDYEVLLTGSVPSNVTGALGSSGFALVESFDGERVPVFYLESNRASKPGPTVVLVHGGPFAEDADMWNVLAGGLALAGFHVLMVNYRGSTGYGERWRLKIIGDPCGGELEDIISATRWAMESGLASHVYIMGYSYGGYMTMCALTKKPGEYKAGVAGASVVDWREMYELSDAAFKSFIHMVFGGRTELWDDRSPINFVENLRDPLMIIHPQNDSRTPLKPVLRFMDKAAEHGKTFEAYIAPDMGHTVNTVEDALKILWPAVQFLLRQEGSVEK
ncbi:MAG: S9 family peptidase [Desulfurococcales archaeon]|nr:S9 family peptidase [Desulfurococcales archaeon]